MKRSSRHLSALVITEEMDMSRRSSFSTGGKAEYYAQPASTEDCISLLEHAYKKNLHVSFIGAGTHILVSDEGIPGLVISTASMKGMSIKGRLLIASPGEALDNIINKAIDHNLSGLERIAGIPGTIAGALSVNAGANSMKLSDVFFYADYLSFDGRIHRRPHFHDAFSEQSSIFSSNGLVVSVALKLNPTRASAEARERKEEYVEKMYIPPSRRFSGEIFKDSKEMKAEDAIRKAGLTGPNGSHAEFSEYQANSILTYPGCTSQEIYTLIRHAEKTVKEKLNICLIPSITMLGSFTD